ncbi:MAG: hypothetical protein NDJ90_00805 [Oligoflexia bacterium]|nr:hypothetical protein [Oligoflexia bacterium]
MGPQNDGATQESRPPELSDLVELARSLNAAGAKYVIIGGIAILQQGFVRATQDIDLLVDRTESNLRKVIDAVGKLPDHAAMELSPADFDEYEVIRVADEIVVDLMIRASGLEYNQAKSGIISVELEGVPIPFASAELLLKMKQGVREKDVLDRKFLEALLARKGESKRL